MQAHEPQPLPLQTLGEPVVEVVVWYNTPLFKRATGIFCVLCAVGAWISMAILLQDLQRESKYTKPFFMTYYVHSSYAVTMFIWALWYFKCTVRLDPTKLEQKITKRCIIGTGILSILSFVGAWVWYLSLQGTSVSANTAIYNSSCVFVFILSIFTLKETLNLMKIASVLLCVIGVVLVSLFEKGSSSYTISQALGYSMLVISASFYAIYETAYGKFIAGQGTRDPVNNFLYLGMIGIWTLIIFWPGIIILNYSGVERFQMPDYNNIIVLTINASLDVIFNASLLVGIMLTSPLFMAVGTILTIPASVLADKLAHDYVLPPLSFIGMAFIVLGFIGLNISDTIKEEVEDKINTPHSSHEAGSIQYKSIHTEQITTHRLPFKWKVAHLFTKELWTNRDCLYKPWRK